MGDRPESYSRVRTSEDKVCRKDMCWSVRTVYFPRKLSDVSGPGLGETGCYNLPLAYGESKIYKTHLIYWLVKIQCEILNNCYLFLLSPTLLTCQYKYTAGALSSTLSNYTISKAPRHKLVDLM